MWHGNGTLTAWNKKGCKNYVSRRRRRTKNTVKKSANIVKKLEKRMGMRRNPICIAFARDAQNTGDLSAQDIQQTCGAADCVLNSTLWWWQNAIKVAYD
jgi:hypothetical protein